MFDDLCGVCVNVCVVMEMVIEINVVRGLNDVFEVMKSDVWWMMWVMCETRATFGDAGAEGEATVRFVSVWVDYLVNEDEYEV